MKNKIAKIFKALQFPSDDFTKSFICLFKTACQDP